MQYYNLKAVGIGVRVGVGVGVGVCVGVGVAVGEGVAVEKSTLFLCSCQQLFSWRAFLELDNPRHKVIIGASEDRRQ